MDQAKEAKVINISDEFADKAIEKTFLSYLLNSDLVKSTFFAVGYQLFVS